MKLLQRPYHLLLLCSLLFALLALFVVDPAQQLDIHLHDTYFVIADHHVAWLLAIIALLLWVIYLPVRRFLYSRLLTWIHVVLSILPLAAMAIWQFGHWTHSPQPARHYMAIEHYQAYTLLLRLQLLLLVAGQLAFPVNLLAGLVRRLRRPS